jgi:hypothetical protein
MLFPQLFRALVVGHLSARRTLVLGNPKDEGFERYAKCPVDGPLSL